MLSINNSVTSAISAFLSQRSLCLAGILACTSANSENNEYYRQEPIFPIPQQVNLDTAKVELGEHLFSDTRLSSNESLACATCHQLKNGGDDNVAFGLSAAADQHIINTPSIFNVRYNFRQNWDGSSQTLHEQIDTVINSSHEFNNQWSIIIDRLQQDSELTKQFNQQYQDGITKENIINALVEFENSLITPNARFDRFLRNEENVLTKEEIQGYHIFKDLGCISCHQGINIGGNLYQKFGVFYDYMAERGNITQIDYGRMNTSNRQSDAFVFKVPSLRNVSVTAPYLHDGSARTLEEAIAIMGRTQLGRRLNDNEITLIKAFLNTLTGQYKNKTLDEAS